MANVLEDMRGVAGRCHELRGNRAGQLSLDLDHPDPSCLGSSFLSQVMIPYLEKMMGEWIGQKSQP